MTTAASNQTAATPATVPKPAYVPFDHSLPGRAAGLFAMLGSWSTDIAKHQMDETQKKLNWAKAYGQLQGHIAELKGLFAGKTTMKISELKGDAKVRGIALMKQINGDLVDLGYCQRLDASGQLVPPATDLPEQPTQLFGTKTRDGLALADPAAADAADQAAKAAAEAGVKRVLSTDPASSATNSTIKLGQRSLVRVANALELMGVDITDTYHGDIPVVEAAGRDIAERSFDVTVDAFRAHQAELTGSSNRELRDAANNFKSWLDNAYKEAYRAPAEVRVRNGLIESDDLATLEGASVRIQTDADTLSQEVNKSVQASSVEVQKGNGWYDASKGAIDLLTRLNRAFTNL